ncbi:PREDICTED: uncharacterized protein LOC106819826, partial [Priapulus caudatus]|uniref:Uncharacterized protein LOC106819826 n=1 Tax=Priapulus caudatus TaxID=37621 RepID=A0ABM1F621_PRICU
EAVWSIWSACSVRCGIGVRTRTQYCVGTSRYACIDRLTRRNKFERGIWKNSCSYGDSAVVVCLTFGLKQTSASCIFTEVVSHALVASEFYSYWDSDCPAGHVRYIDCFGMRQKDGTCRPNGRYGGWTDWRNLSAEFSTCMCERGAPLTGIADVDVNTTATSVVDDSPVPVSRYRFCTSPPPLPHPLMKKLYCQGSMFAEGVGCEALLCNGTNCNDLHYKVRGGATD